MLGLDPADWLRSTCDRLVMLGCLMARQCCFGEGEAVRGTLCNLLMAVHSVGPSGYLIWSTALVVHVVDLVDRFVVSILKDGKFAFVGVQAA